MGWTSPEITGASYDGIWEALVDKARCPEKYMDVSNVTVADRAGFLARSMTVNAKQKRVEEHIYACEEKSEIIYRVVDGHTKRETDDEKVMAVKQEPLRIEFFHRHVSDGYRKFWPAPVTVVQSMLKDIISAASTMDTQTGIVGLGVQSEPIFGVTHDSMWRALVESIREPHRFYKASGVKIEDCNGFVRRTSTVNGKTTTEKIFVHEPTCELIYRQLDNGVESELERVVALRSHPLALEFHQRNKADGFRVSWDMPRGAPLTAVESYVREAKLMDTAPPTTIGYGITSDPITDCAYDSIFAAVEKSIKQPWLAIDVDKDSCEVKDCSGFVERKMRLQASGEIVSERIVVNEELGEVCYNKCDKYGKPGPVERVLAIHTPLRLEFFERNVSNGVRLNWTAPFDVARQTFENIVKIAQGIETQTSDVIGYGLASKPVTGLTQDALWRAMLYCVRNPAKCGMMVDNVQVTDKPGFMQRTMRLLGKPGKPTVTDNVRVVESALEIVYTPVVNGKEGGEERVFAMRSDPLRMELFARNASDEMRLEWQAPLAVANDIFDAVMRGSGELGTKSEEPSIKFTYFNVEGGGECVRLAFVLGGVPYVDERIDMPTQWPTLKPKAPFGQLPLMTVNGSQPIAQSAGMLRYAAKVAGLVPDDPVEFLKAEEVIGLSWDLVTAITPSMQLDRRPQLYGYTGTPQSELTRIAVDMREKLSADDGEINRFLGYLDGLLAKNGTGWFVGDKPSIAECEVIPRLRSLRKGNRDGFPKEIVDKHKNLMRMYWAFHDLPAVRAHYKGVPPY